MDDFGFYLVMTNPVAGYEKCAEAAVEAGVSMLQLRMKHVSRDEVLAMARRIRSITRGTATRFIVNDSPEIAAASEADGVHVGQDDMPVGEVRGRWPGIGIVGLSTHNPAQVSSAASAEGAARPDYIGVGPVYATPTKDIPDPVLGLETMGRMVAASPYPAVAIGGLNLSNIGGVIRSGARNFAVVREVCSSNDPLSAIKRILDAAAAAGL